MKRGRTLLNVMVGVAMAITLVSAGPVTVAQAGEIKIGALIPLTGFASGFGQNQKVGLELAVEEINKAGGIDGKTLEVIIYDTESKGEKAIFGFRRLATQDKVLAVLGPFPVSYTHLTLPTN